MLPPLVLHPKPTSIPQTCLRADLESYQINNVGFACNTCAFFLRDTPGLCAYNDDSSEYVQNGSTLRNFHIKKQLGEKDRRSIYLVNIHPTHVRRAEAILHIEPYMSKRTLLEAKNPCSRRQTSL